MDILHGLYEQLLPISLPTSLQIFLFERLASLESRIAAGGNEAIHLSAVVGTFQLARALAASDPSKTLNRAPILRGH